MNANGEQVIRGLRGGTDRAVVSPDAIVVHWLQRNRPVRRHEKKRGPPVMSVEQINVTIGTAGHIDHGKTALVKLLTGCDTDRLKAEKERGISIDLGFAPCKIADSEVGIVDVPGHENFIKTMVAGAGGMDGVILVVAADDGVMPQTREHLDILRLLGIEHGFVALTKIDRVDSDHVELATEETAELLRGTFLEGAPICPLSNITGQGFDGFYQTLAQLLEGIRPRPVDNVFRVPLDRAFSSQGHGTIVAGIPVAGQAHLGDELELLPRGQIGRIRQIEVYGRSSDTVTAGQCAAINVPQWDYDSVGRGDVAATPGYFQASTWFACKLRMLPRAKLTLKTAQAIKFHTGTSETPAAIYPMQGDRIAAGSDYLVQIRTRVPVVAGPGDHFILRSLSPVRTIGGGTIIESLQKRLKRNRPAVNDDLQRRAEAVGAETAFVEYCVRTAPALAAGEADLAARAKTPRKRLPEILADLTGRKRVVSLGSSLYIHVDTLAEATSGLLAALTSFHQHSPESPGMTVEQLREAVGIDRAVLRALIGRLKQDGRLVEQDSRLALAQHQASFGADAERLEEIESWFRDDAFRPPSLDDVGRKLGIDQAAVKRLLGILREHGRLLAVGSLVFHRQAVDRALELVVEHISKEGKLESVDFKYLLDTSRKFAIPLLDHLDRSGKTRREGNTRYLKTPPS